MPAMRRLSPSRGMLGPLCVIGLLSSLAGCKDEKMGVEKRAEEIAKAAASASVAASASASAPDPKEEKYATALKTLRERQKAQLAALAKIYQGASEEERKAFKDFFAPTKEQEKEADELSKEAAFAGKEGMALKKYELQDAKLDASMTGGTTDVYVEESQRGKGRCTIYKVEWKDFDGKWRRVRRYDFRIIPCE